MALLLRQLRLAIALSILLASSLCSGLASRGPQCPAISPASGLENRFYTWRQGQQIRYQKCSNDNANSNNNINSIGPPVLLIHGLFVNCDHWRRTMVALQTAGYTNAYAMDLFGCGFSAKPPADSEVAQLCNGENGRFFCDDEHELMHGNEEDDMALPSQRRQPSVMRNVQLGSSNGRDTRVVNVDLRHPLRSPYNFYTWANQINDFCRDVILPENPSHPKVSLVANSIGTMSALQAIIDRPDLYTGAFIVCPNFRELHSAELPVAPIALPILQSSQRFLRENGQSIFDFLAKPATVKNILKEPYAVTSAVDDELVQVLLDPLLTPGASAVVFDTLSYSAGPLPEQQLQQFPPDRPVWVCYGDQDPWTPGPRVEALTRYAPVQKVVPIASVGHCPHDEAPELVNPLLLEFLDSVNRSD